MKSERWSTPSEIRRALTGDHVRDQGGPILVYHNGHHWTYTGEGHSIIVGSTGSGKSRRCSIPMVMSMLRAKESLVCADPKGEIYASAAHLLTDDYKVIVLDFRRILESAACNILAPIVHLYKTGREEDKQAAMEMLDYVSRALYPIRGKDPFWETSAQSVFIGAVRALMDHAEPEAVTISNVFQFVTMGDERFGGPGNTYLKEFLGMIPSDSSSAMELHSYAYTAEETRGGIRSTFLQGLTPYIRSDGVISMMSGDDLKIHELDGETPTAVFIILPDESPTYDGICGIIVNELLTHYIRIAHDRYNGRLPRRLNVVLEEFGNIGHAIPNLPHLMAAGRSRNVRCQIILQSFAQLNDIYGPAKATSVRENASLLVAYRTTHWDSLCELSRLCGEREAERGGRLVREPLITPADLSAMQIGQALVMIAGGTKFITWLPDFTEVFPVNSTAAAVSLPHVTRKPPVFFDIQAHVKAAKKKKMDEMLAGFSEKAPPSSADTPTDPPIFSLPVVPPLFSVPVDTADPVPPAAEEIQLPPPPELDFPLPFEDFISRIDAELKLQEQEEPEKSDAVPELLHSLHKAAREAAGFVRKIPFRKLFSIRKESRTTADAQSGSGRDGKL